MKNVQKQCYSLISFRNVKLKFQKMYNISQNKHEMLTKCPTTCVYNIFKSGTLNSSGRRKGYFSMFSIWHIHAACGRSLSRDPWPSTNVHMSVKKALEESLECRREQPGLGWLWLRPFSACVCLRYREKLLHYWSTIVRREDWKRQLQFLQRQKTRTGSIMWGGSRLNYWCVRAPVMRTGVYLLPAATHTHTNTHTRGSRMDLQHYFSVVAVSIKGMTGKSCNQ